MIHGYNPDVITELRHVLSITNLFFYMRCLAKSALTLEKGSSVCEEEDAGGLRQQSQAIDGEEAKLFKAKKKEILVQVPSCHCFES